MVEKILKDFQRKSRNKIISRIEELLEYGENGTITYQSPTGSGKTYTICKTISKLNEDHPEIDKCYIWVTIGKGDLHVQSYRSLKEEISNCHLLENEFFGSREIIEKDEIVVVNWEKLRSKDKENGEWKNILMKEKETINFIELLQNTKNIGRKIILIIDESHTNAKSERSLELRDDIICPNITIEMSATPSFSDDVQLIKVNPNDPIEEGMIKKEIIVNEKIDQIQEDEMTSQEIIMEAAWKKLEQLKASFNKEGSNVKPLALIQLPTSKEGDYKKEFVETFLASKGINYDNGKLACWLNEEKVNNERENVIPNNARVECLMFKQAIDTGWDCPRAHILVKFRETKSIIFEIQTVGRILRMPESFHYENDELNTGYVYTNIQSIHVKREEYNPNIIKSACSHRSEKYENLGLASFYKNKLDQRDITSKIYDVLEEVSCEYFGIEKNCSDINNCIEIVSKKIDLKSSRSIIPMMLNEVIDTSKFDNLTKFDVLEDKPTMANLSEEDIGLTFEKIIKDNIKGFIKSRSFSPIKTAIFLWFSKYLGFKLTGFEAIEIQSIFINNKEIFSQIINMSIEKYEPLIKKEITEKNESNNGTIFNWEISESRNYNPNTHNKFDYKSSIYNPCYLKFDSDIEKEFIDLIDGKVEWWWRNGDEHKKDNFGIKYYDGEEEKTFQPDYLVKYKDGKLGIYDTKSSGDREDKNKLKSESLQKYIETENKKGKNLRGGIIIKPNKQFRINKNKEYITFKECPKDWDYFEI